MADRSPPRAIRVLAWAVAVGVVLWIGSVTVSAVIVGGATAFPWLQRAKSDPRPAWVLVVQMSGFTGFQLTLGASAAMVAWYLRSAIVTGAPEPPR